MDKFVAMTPCPWSNNEGIVTNGKPVCRDNLRETVKASIKAVDDSGFNFLMWQEQEGEDVVLSDEVRK